MTNRSFESQVPFQGSQLPMNSYDERRTFYDLDDFSGVQNHAIFPPTKAPGSGNMLNIRHHNKGINPLFNSSVLCVILFVLFNCLERFQHPPGIDTSMPSSLQLRGGQPDARKKF